MEISRRRLICGSALLAAAAICADPAHADSPPAGSIEAQLTGLEDRYDANLGFYGMNLNSGRTLAHRENDLFATCSAFKAYVAGQVLQRDQRGTLSIDDPVYIDPAVLIPGASPVTEPQVGSYLTLSELCAAAVRQSDNTATNLLLGILGGPSSVTDFARSVGDDRTWMVRWETELNSALPGDPRDTTSPRAMGTGFATMLTGNVFDDSHRDQLESWMRSITSGDKRIRAGMPPGWAVADKTGTGDYASTNDIGVAFGPAGERLLLAIMARTRSDDSQAPALDELIADTTRLAVPWLLA